MTRPIAGVESYPQAFLKNPGDGSRGLFKAN